MFVDKQEIRRITIQGIELTLELNQYVFAPSPNGSFYADTLRIHSGERVMDIGTGSGILTIFAALKGLSYVLQILKKKPLNSARKIVCSIRYKPISGRVLCLERLLVHLM